MIVVATSTSVQASVSLGLAVCFYSGGYSTEMIGPPVGIRERGIYIPPQIYVT